LLLKDYFYKHLHQFTLLTLRSHADPSFSYIELLKFMAADILKRIDPMEKAKAKAHPTSGVKLVPKLGKRVAIPAPIKRQVWLRDQGKCTFVDRKTGKRCDSSHFIEFDLIVPVALGGSNELKNLRLRCRHIISANR
jgi:hypothetical protein